MNSNACPALAEPKKTYDFYAFISYKHLDKRWGKWVQKQLEYYRLPNRLCKELELPKRVTPIFRDETDLSGGKNVLEHLVENIRRSKFLIVICTRHMQHNPTYIDYEIESFLAAGNPPGRILPLIIDGEPNASDPEKECLPPALRALGESMPLGITMNHRKRGETVLKLIACILELDLSALRSHDQQRRNRRVIAGLGMGMAASLLFGAFIAWEALSVKQAGLREQLIYGEDTFRRGDRLGAASIAETVLEDVHLLMEPAIGENAAELALLSSIRPKYMPMARLCAAGADTRLLFSNDGQHVLVVAENTVTKYSLTGDKVMTFDISQKAHQIVDVCSDGIHAAVVTFYLPGLEGSHLWLWNMQTDQAVAQLVASTSYDHNDEKMGYLGGVVNAAFSPDGTILCAYRDSEGYYNENDELAAWSVADGTKLFSFSAELLGKMNQPYEVEAFEFIDNTTLHWTGSGAHVYYTLGQEAPVAVSKRKVPPLGSDSVFSIGHQRYSLAKTEGAAIITDLATDISVTVEAAGEWEFVECNGYVLLLSQVQGTIEQAWLVNLETMKLCPAAESITAACAGRTLTAADHLTGSPYLYMWLSDYSVYRFHVGSGECSTVSLPTGSMPLAATPTGDVFTCTRGGQTRLMEVGPNGVRSYTLGDSEEALHASAAFSPATPYMAMEHNGEYYIYPCSHPGQALENGLPLRNDVFYAASPDGQLLVQGKDRALTAWLGDKTILQTELPDDVVTVLAADNCLYAVTKSMLLQYDSHGTLLRTHAAPNDYCFASAKLSRGGNRLVLLVAKDTFFEDIPHTLSLLEAENLSPVSGLSSLVYVAPSSDSRAAYDISEDGKWIATVIRTYQKSKDQYQLSINLYSGMDGTLVAQTQNVNNLDVSVLELTGHPSGIASAHRQQYVTFADNNTLLSGLQYGTWVFDLENLQTLTFLSEGTHCDALPVLLSDGQLLYPSNGLHVWNVRDGTMKTAIAHPVEENGINAMLKTENLHRLTLSEDERWLAFTGANTTHLYRTDNWETQSVFATQPCRIVYLSDSLILYATPDGLWRFTR